MRRLVFALALLAASAGAQDAADWPEADPVDVASLDALIETVYAVISGPATEERDWDRFRSLHHPEARLIPTGVTPDGERIARVMSVDDYVELGSRTFREAPIFQGKGFYEVEAARRVERYGSIAHVWSTYESRLDPAEEPFARGINSMQAFWDGERWNMLSIFWHQEDEATPIPVPYLPEGP
ncbi:hypothetical protein [Rubrivirga marina]|uniref:DUF4440 domain-containing protein n=1 Tax=Rubrivirga marina TaxID=1196024 RepID=A0A271IZC5_9BACT|nr:hypothetical protein [Rubrivirga marina]PAP76055.1 hypothetical protein BSZ37_06165 [Rubrivirga marina]